jgi:heme/copper-type cytochrome/quinol oxidase subunit 3
MLVGLALYGWAIVQSLRRPPDAPSDPWGAGTLEWSVPSAPPPFNHREIPLVTSREPLAAPRVGGAARPPSVWRPERTRDVPAEGRLWPEILLVTMFDARPQAIAIMAGSSAMPFLLALTMTIVSAALLFEIYPVALVISVVSVPLILKWLWPSRAERAYATAGATLGGADLPVFTTGTSALGWWAMALTIVALGASLALAVFSYLYLVYAGPDVLPIRTPPLGRALASVAIGLAAIVPAAWALRAIRRGDQVRLRLGLAAALVAGAISLAVFGLDLVSLGLAPRDNAYEAMFATLAGYQVVLTIVALAAVAFVKVQAWLGFFDDRRHLAVENVVLLWGFTATSAAVTVATLYLTPYVLPVAIQ